jgi:hypothetical protein
VALTGLSLASLIGLRLKKNMQEGFEVLPYVPEKTETTPQGETKVKDTENGYPNAVATSASRYNMLTNMINPVTNSIIPVGSDKTIIERAQNTVASALGTNPIGYAAEVLNLQNFKNKYTPRADSQKSLYGAIQFCREKAAELDRPFTYTKENGEVVQGARDEKNNWNFDSMCGICVTRGTDENGEPFSTTNGKPRGMLVNPDTKEAAYMDRDSKGLPFAQVTPALGTCEGAPTNPSFATNDDELEKFKGRLDCMNVKALDAEPDYEKISDPAAREAARKKWEESRKYCGLCYQNDEYSYVGPNPNTNTVVLVLRGIGNASVFVRDRSVKTIALSDLTDSRVELIGAKEGDTFSVRVSSPNPQAQIATVYGFMESTNGNGGLFTMPLNLLFTVDDRTGQKPSLSGGFYTFTNEKVNITTAKIQTGKAVLSETNKPDMNLRAVLPFTFVQPSEFSAIDCPTSPYQVRLSSANAFSSDQPCFAKGTRPGKYNDECLRGRITDAGCTNAGTLYENPSQLNQDEKGQDRTLDQIYTYLTRTVKPLDMIDPKMTKLCTGRDITTPCDTFIAQPDLKLGPIAKRADTDPLKLQLQKCMSYIYDNEGQNESGANTKIGPTYSEPISFRNNQKIRKNIYCLPEGELNPSHSNPALANSALNKLVEYYDGTLTIDRKTGFEGVKAFLNSRFKTSVDQTRNANTDSDRQVAIKQCFGDKINLPNLEELQITAAKRVVRDPCGVMARFVRVLPSLLWSDSFIEIAQLVVVDSNGNNVALRSNVVNESTPPFENSTIFSASRAIDGMMFNKITNFYISAFPGGNAQFFMDLGTTTDITKIIFYSRGDAGRVDNRRKQGIRVQLLDANRRVLNETILNNQLVEEINYLSPNAPTTCKNELTITTTLPSIPPNMIRGLFVRFSRLVMGCNPGRNPNEFGWGKVVGTPRGMTSLNIQDNFSSGSVFPPISDNFLVIARGYYYASGPGILDLETVSDDGIIVLFNGRPVIDNWTLHGPTRDRANTINIPSAGRYSFEIRFFECGGGAVCYLEYRVNDRIGKFLTDLSSHFAYDPVEEFNANVAYNVRAQQMYPWS